MFIKSAAHRLPEQPSSRRTIPPLGNRERDVEIGGDLGGVFDGRSITVLKEASITGHLGADIIEIYGAVCGTIRGRTVHVRRGGHIEGEVEYGTLKVDPGATVNARCIPN